MGDDEVEVDDEHHRSWQDSRGKRSKGIKGAIILMHAGSTPEADALDTLMTLLEKKGYQMVTITQVLQ